MQPDSADDIRLVCADGRRIAAAAFRPAAAPRLSVLINPGTSIPRRFYRYFAAWLAAQGCLVITYDNRGIGDSANGPRDSFLTSDWGAQDQAAATRWLLDHTDAPLVSVSHSFGTTLMGLCPMVGRLRAVVAVGSHYFRRHELPLAYRLKQRYDRHLRLPWYLWRHGAYTTPGVDFTMPPEAARQMMQWQYRRYFFSDQPHHPEHPHFAELRCPLRHYVISDDEMVPERQARALVELYPNAHGETLLLEPQRFGVPQIGHFGFFRKSAPEALWRETLDWLLEASR